MHKATKVFKGQLPSSQGLSLPIEGILLRITDTMQQKSILALPLYNEFCFLKASSQDVQSLNTIFVNRKVLYHVASDVRNSQARSRECFCDIYTLGFHKSLQNKVDYDTIVTTPCSRNHASAIQWSKLQIIVAM